MKNKPKNPVSQPATIGKFLVRFGTLIGICVVLLVLGIRSPNFFAVSNLFDVLKQGSTLTLIAVAQTVVLAAGGFDMSGGSLMQFTCNITAGMVIAGNDPFLAILACTLLGMVTGIVNSGIINLLRIPPFVATLGTSLILNGLSLLYNGGVALTFGYHPVLSVLGQGYLGPVPVIFIITVAILAVVHVFMKHTRTGLRMYAAGGNPAAAEYKGISSKRCMFVAFFIAGIVLGLAGVLQAAYNYGASALSTGMDVLISALAAALLGSTFSRTGELSVIGTAISAMFIAALSNGLIINGVSNQIINGTLGLILIISVIPTVVYKREIGQVTIF